MFDPITAIAAGSVASAGVGLFGAYKQSKVKAPKPPDFSKMPPPEMDALPGAPKLSTAPEMGALPGAPKLSTAPEMGALPGAPKLSTAPEMGALPGIADIPPPPKPSTFKMYDDKGNVTAEASWDETAGSYSFKRGPLSPEEQAIKEKKASIRKQMLSNLDKTPDERLKMYEEYGKAYSDRLHSELDPKYQQAVRSTEENLAGKGMFGSRAYVDTMAEMDRNKRLADTDIANRSFMAREDLANADQAKWQNTLNTIESQNMADKQFGLQEYRAALEGAQAGTDTAMKSYLADVGNKQWEYGAGLDLFRTQDDASMRRYLADVGNEQWQYGAGLDLFRTQDDAAMRRYLADVGNEQWKYNTDMSRWAATEDAKMNRWRGQTGAAMDSYNAGLNKYQTDVNKWGGISNSMMDTASGLAYLYGYKGNPAPKTTGGAASGGGGSWAGSNTNYGGLASLRTSFNAERL